MKFAGDGGGGDSLQRAWENLLDGGKKNKKNVCYPEIFSEKRLSENKKFEDYYSGLSQLASLITFHHGICQQADAVIVT